MKINWRGLTQSLFENLLVAYVLFIMVDWLWPSIISKYVPLDYLQYATILFGLVAVIWPPKPKPQRAMTVNEGLVAGGVGVAVAGFLLAHSQDLGWFSWALPILAGVLIVLVGGVARGRDDHEPAFLLSWKTALFSLLALIFLAVVLSYIVGARAWQLVFGTVFAFFIPGFAASLALYPADDLRSPGWIERLGLSVGMSVVLVPLLVFYLNFLGVRIGLASVVVSVALIVLVSLAMVVRHMRSKRKNEGASAPAPTKALTNSKEKKNPVAKRVVAKAAVKKGGSRRQRGA